MAKKSFTWKQFWQDLGSRRWIFLLVMGLLLVVIAIPLDQTEKKDEEVFQKENNATDGSYSADSVEKTDSSWTAYEKELEQRLTILLSTVEGAGKTEVMITLSRSSQLVLQTNESREESRIRETDAQGGIRDNTQLRQDTETVLTGGSSTGTPYVIGRQMPQVEGVVVACEGGDRSVVKSEISAAVQALFDLAPHKIKVCKMASK